MVPAERVQSGVRIEKRLLKVLKGLTEDLDLSLGDPLEAVLLHSFEWRSLFDAATVRVIEQLKAVDALDVTAADGHHLQDTGR